MVTVPLNPGKNLTVICEVVAMNHLLRYSGVDSARAFNDRLLKRLAERRPLQGDLEEDNERAPARGDRVAPGGFPGAARPGRPDHRREPPTRSRARPSRRPRRR